MSNGDRLAFSDVELLVLIGNEGYAEFWKNRFEKVNTSYQLLKRLVSEFSTEIRKNFPPESDFNDQPIPNRFKISTESKNDRIKSVVPTAHLQSSKKIEDENPPQNPIVADNVTIPNNAASTTNTNPPDLVDVQMAEKPQENRNEHKKHTKKKKFFVFSLSLLDDRKIEKNLQFFKKI